MAPVQTSGCAAQNLSSELLREKARSTAVAQA